MAKISNAEKIMRSTYSLNEHLHRIGVPESLRPQLVGTCLLYLSSLLDQQDSPFFTNNRLDDLSLKWSLMSKADFHAQIKNAVTGMLRSGEEMAAELIASGLLQEPAVQALSDKDWKELLEDISRNVYTHIAYNGQDVLHLFFTTFSKYTGKADRNQTFTPEHITDFMARAAGVNKDSVVLDACAGSGSFLVKSITLALADAAGMENVRWMAETVLSIRENQVFGIECEPRAWGLSATNMLLHGSRPSNICLGSCFEADDFIRKVHPSVILLNPPFVSKPRSIPARYREDWRSANDGYTDPTKGFVFVQYLADIAREEGWEGTKLAVLLPLSTAIGNSTILEFTKKQILASNTLDAVITLPQDIFFPGAQVQVCCMIFLLNKPHFGKDGSARRETFFLYGKDDGFKKKRNIGRVEQFGEDGKSLWKQKEEEWLTLYRERKAKLGLSALHKVDGKMEWMCEAYMETDSDSADESEFRNTIREYFAYELRRPDRSRGLGSAEGSSFRKEPEPCALDGRRWARYQLEDLFSVSATKTAPLETLEALETGDDSGLYPYVSTQATNNGVAGFYPCWSEEGGVLTVDSAVLGTCFYQRTRFSASDHVEKLTPRFPMNTGIALFFVTLLNRDLYKYSFGRKRSKKILKAEQISLPSGQDGSPDWKWIDGFMKRLLQEEKHRAANILSD